MDSVAKVLLYVKDLDQLEINRLRNSATRAHLSRRRAEEDLRRFEKRWCMNSITVMKVKFSSQTRISVDGRAY